MSISRSRWKSGRNVARFDRGRLGGFRIAGVLPGLPAAVQQAGPLYADELQQPPGARGAGRIGAVHDHPRFRSIPKSPDRRGPELAVLQARHICDCSVQLGRSRCTAPGMWPPHRPPRRARPGFDRCGPRFAARPSAAECSQGVPPAPAGASWSIQQVPAGPSRAKRRRTAGRRPLSTSECSLLLADSIPYPWLGRFCYDTALPDTHDSANRMLALRSTQGPMRLHGDRVSANPRPGALPPTRPQPQLHPCDATTSAISPSSPTSTTARRRWSIACCARAGSSATASCRRAHPRLQRPGAGARDHDPGQEHRAALPGREDQHHRHARPRRFRRRGRTRAAHGRRGPGAGRRGRRPDAADALRAVQGPGLRPEADRGDQQDRPAGRPAARGPRRGVRTVPGTGRRRSPGRFPAPLRQRPRRLRHARSAVQRGTSMQPLLDMVLRRDPRPGGRAGRAAADAGHHAGLVRVRRPDRHRPDSSAARSARARAWP